MSDSETWARLEHAAELGLFVCAWNHLHELLGHLYCMTEHDGLSDDALRCWHMVRNDRTQRKMLRRSAENQLAARPDLMDDVTWLLDQVDTIAEPRNDAVHTSYAVLLDGPNAEVIADPHFGNRRSTNMAGKNLIQVFRQWRGDVVSLSEYCDSLYQRVNDEEAPIMNRPAVPCCHTGVALPP